MAITYLLIRHGEAEGNLERRFIGQTDVPLSEHGRRQAELLTERLVKLPITGVITSDLQRAHDTVSPTAERLGLPVEDDRRLREIDNGEWNALLPHEVEAGYPEMWARYTGGEDVLRPGGERWAHVQARVVEAIEEDAGRRAEGDMVVVGTHGGPIMGVVLWAIGLGIKGNIFTGPFIPVSNGSITTLELPAVKLIGLNDIGHLGDLATDSRLRFFDRR